MSGFTPPGECLVCGADVPAKAKACPECGASADTGWGEESVYDGLDLPSDEPPQEPRSVHPTAWIAAVALVMIIVLLLLFVVGRA